MPIVTYERFCVLRAPFPLTDMTASKHRPALVLSEATHCNISVGHAVLAMITSAGKSPWPLDHAILDLATAGPGAPSLVRMKPFTLDLSPVRGILGHLAAQDQVAIQKSLHALLQGGLS
jgi:mRNA interferase MazF